MNIKEYIENIPMWANKKNSLKSIREFLANMDIKNNKKIPIIHVAGTNGKGSICAYLSNILADMGYRIGTFISPHLVEVNERIRINMQAISDEEFKILGNYVKDLSNTLNKKGLENPTYFEFLFYMAIKYFYNKEVDFIVLETGLGGLYDVTNAIEGKDLCIISSISKDHEQYLGATIKEIVAQKAGILRKNINLVYDNNNIEVEKEMEKQILTYGLKVAKKVTDFSKYIPDFDLDIELQNLNATYKMKNAALSIVATKELFDLGYLREFDLENIKNSILKTTWQGRMQEITKDVYIDGAHNEDGILEFTKNCKSMCQKNRKKANILISIVADKDIQAMLGKLKYIETYISKIYIAKMNNYRAAELEDMEEVLSRYIDIEFIEKNSVISAFEDMLDEKKDEEICFCIGSLYMIGEILKYWKGRIEC